MGKIPAVAKFFVDRVSGCAKIDFNGEAARRCDTR
jgi:hypothetical protein